jgi:alpha-tubulin suppressor-like RCC1 family protein
MKSMRSPSTRVRSLSLVLLTALGAGCAPLDGATADPAARPEPTDVEATSSSLLIQPGKRVSVGGAHACAILERGAVKCWGNNSVGQLGYGDTVQRGDAAAEMGEGLPFVNLGTGRTATQLSLGDSFSCALLDNGTVKCWGNDFSGQLGQGDTVTRGDNANEMGDSLLPIPLGTGRKAVSIAAGATHVCAILDTGDLKCWGANTNGQLGLGDVNYRGDGPNEMGDSLPAVSLGVGRKVISVGAGSLHTCALLDNNTVKCWGGGGLGATGYGDLVARGDGPNEMGAALPAVNLGTNRKAKALGVGYQNTCAILDDDSLKCWGGAGAGQLGLGNTANRGDNAGEMGDALPAINLGTGRKARQVVVASAHVCALLDNGAVKCWGANTEGELGLGDVNNRGDNAGEMGDALPALNFAAGLTVAALSEGGQPTSTCVTFTSGRVKCWGDNSHAQLGLGNLANRGDNPNEMGSLLPYVNLGAKRGVVAVEASIQTVCALLSSGDLKCWGSGALGLGDTNYRGDNPGEMGNNLPIVNVGAGRKVKSFDVADMTACAILDNDTLKCWGDNDLGQLGVGDTLDRGWAAGQMGDSLPVINLGTGRTAKKVVPLDGATCALLDNDTVKCWGWGIYGLLGNGTIDMVGDGPNEMGNALPAIDFGTGHTVKQLAGGGVHACVILDDDTVKCWGDNRGGTLGLGDTNYRGDNPGEMGNNLPVVNLGTGRKAKQLTVGTSHACALLDNGKLKCWGLNDWGQLGLGDTATRGDQTSDMGDALPYVDIGTGRSIVAVTAGDSTTCVLRDDQSYVCWGDNVNGSLGIDTSDNRGDAPGEMGNALVPVKLNGGTLRPAIPLSTTVSTLMADETGCVVVGTGALKCWGRNVSGQLGLGHTNPIGDSAGEMATLGYVDLGTE